MLGNKDQGTYHFGSVWQWGLFVKPGYHDQNCSAHIAELLLAPALLPSHLPLISREAILLQLLPESKDWCEDPWADLTCWKVHRKEEGQECRRWGMEEENKNNSGATHDIPLSTPFWAFLPSFCFVTFQPEAFWYWLSVYNAMNSRHCFFQVIWAFILLHWL